MSKGWLGFQGEQDKLLKGQGELPMGITTDKLGSYVVAKRGVMASVPHCRDRYANNRAEV